MKRKAPAEVSLHTDRVHWTRLPASLRRQLVASVELVSAIRQRMRDEIQVTSLPPVWIHDAIWSDPARTAFIDGRAGALRHGTRTLLGLELPAQTVLSGDEEMIRAVLLHESGHCFYYATRIVDLKDSGIPGPLLIQDLRGDDSVYTDEAADRARLVIPSEWFTGEAARAFPYWHDPRLSWEGQDDDDRLAELKPLRVEDGSQRFSATSVWIPDDWITHIRHLRDRQPSVPDSAG